MGDLYKSAFSMAHHPVSIGANFGEPNLRLGPNPEIAGPRNLGINKSSEVKDYPFGFE